MLRVAHLTNRCSRPLAAVESDCAHTANTVPAFDRQRVLIGRMTSEAQPTAMPRNAQSLPRIAKIASRKGDQINCRKTERRPELSKQHTSGKRWMIAALALIAVCLSDVARLNAVPSSEQHEMSGVVQQVRHETIAILLSGGSKREVFALTKDTKFIRDGAFTSADALRPGTQVQLRCSHPIFGSKPVGLPRGLANTYLPKE